MNQLAHTSLARHPAIPVWAVLMLVTGLSWWLSDHQASNIDTRQMILGAVLTLAFVKVQLVGEYFMELRHAPVSLRLIFTGWVIATCVAVVALCLRA